MEDLLYNEQKSKIMITLILLTIINLNFINTIEPSYNVPLFKVSTGSSAKNCISGSGACKAIPLQGEPKKNNELIAKITLDKNNKLRFEYDKNAFNLKAKESIFSSNYLRQDGYLEITRDAAMIIYNKDTTLLINPGFYPSEITETTIIIKY